jgi:TolA-binding protein
MVQRTGQDIAGRHAWSHGARRAGVWLAVLAAAGVAAAGTVDANRKAEILTSGKAALEDEFYSAAARQFQTYLSLEGLSPTETAEGMVLLARALCGRGEYAEALRVLGPVAGRPGTPRADEFAFWRASAGYGLGECRDALARLSDFEVRYPESLYIPQALRLRAKCLLKTGEGNRALDEFRNFDQRCGQSADGPSNLLDWAQALVVLNRGEEAYRIFERLLSLPPETDVAQQARYWLGQLYLREAKWPEARLTLESLATQETARVDRRTEALYALAGVWEAQQNLTEATNVVTAGILRAPTLELKLTGQTLLGQLLIRMNRVDDGAAMLKAVVQENPSGPAAGPLQLQLAQAYLDASNSVRALEEYQQYLEAFTNRTGQAQALRGQGWALLNEGRYSEAATAFDKAAELFTNRAEKAESLFKVADAHYANSQYKLALDSYERVAREFPDLQLASDARLQACESQVRLDRTEEAEKRLRSLADERLGTPTGERALLRVAELAEETGRLPEAVVRYEAVMKTYTNGVHYDNALFSHGLLSYQLLRFNEALSDFDRVLRDFPTGRFGGQAYYMRGWCFYMMGRDKESLAVCRDFLKKYPDSQWVPEVLFWIGEYEYNHGTYDRAEEAFVQLAEKRAGHPLAADARFWAGRAAMKAKEYRRAIEHFTRLAKDFQDSPKLPDARLHQGDALAEMADFSGAILIFDEMIGRYPTNATADLARIRKGDCQFTLGAKDTKRYEEAMATYRVVAESATAAFDLRLQAEYKIGRCMDKLGRTEEAFEQYYKVINQYLFRRSQGAEAGGTTEIWFTRAAFNAADIGEARKDWRRALRVLQRVVEAGVPAAGDAQARINRIRSEHWLLY